MIFICTFFYGIDSTAKSGCFKGGCVILAGKDVHKLETERLSDKVHARLRVVSGRGRESPRGEYIRGSAGGSGRKAVVPFD